MSILSDKLSLFYDMARGQQNHIVKSGYRCKRTPDLTIWWQSN